MKISELKSRQSNINVEGVIKEIGETRNIRKFGREIRVANAVLEDDSGSIKLTLWNDDIIRFKEGDAVRVVNGYVNEFQGENQLTSGKFGRIEKLNESSSSSEESASESEDPNETPGIEKELSDSENSEEESAESEDSSDTEEVEY